MLLPIACTRDVVYLHTGSSPFPERRHAPLDHGGGRASCLKSQPSKAGSPQHTDMPASLLYQTQSLLNLPQLDEELASVNTWLQSSPNKPKTNNLIQAVQPRS